MRYILRKNTFYLNVKINARADLPGPFTTEKDSTLKRTSPLLFAVIAFIVGLNLRPILASVGPLFSVLQREAGLTATQFSLLTTLPVAMMGLAALCGPWLLARVGAVRGIMLSSLSCLRPVCCAVLAPHRRVLWAPRYWAGPA